MERTEEAQNNIKNKRKEIRWKVVTDYKRMSAMGKGGGQKKNDEKLHILFILFSFAEWRDRDARKNRRQYSVSVCGVGWSMSVLCWIRRSAGQIIAALYFNIHSLISNLISDLVVKRSKKQWYQVLRKARRRSDQCTSNSRIREMVRRAGSWIVQSNNAGLSRFNRHIVLRWLLNVHNP